MKKFLFFLLFPSYLFAQKFSEAEISKWQSQAKNVTIIRDFWGVPHIYGKTDADCVFGVAYAQAEDNMQQVEDNFIRSVGKGAEIHGQQAWINDQLVHAFEFVKLSKQEYTGASSHMRSLYDAYAAGLNYFLSKNPAYKPILLSRFEPWHPLAMIRYFYYVHDVIPMVGISNSDLQQQFKIDIDTHSTGSNAWAIGPKKTGGKSSMLYFSPHRSLFGNGTFNEVHVESEQGWSFLFPRKPTTTGVYPGQSVLRSTSVTGTALL
jgi:acyl-homoserine lactone acylase PvdQ